MGMKRRPAAEAEYVIFYCFYGTDTSLSSDENKRMKHSDIYVLIGDLEHNDDFLGMVDANGTTLQMIYDAERDTYWIEIPDPPRQGSYGATVTFDDLVDLMKTLPPEFSVEAFPGFEFQSW